MAGIWDDACTLAASLRSGQVSPAEVVGAAIERIEALDGRLNAVIHPRFEAARAEAAGPLPDGPLRGVPVLVKDLGASMAGDPRHDGTRVLRDAAWVPDHDATVVGRLRQAGAVIVGRTNVPEMGTTITTEPVSRGPCRNPWDLGHSTGGSSGGSAAAVSAGFVPVAHASDGGGSIRVPASECALVGLKPSRGRISRGPDQGEGWMGGSTDGAVTRSVRDTALVLDVMAGFEPGDPYTAPALPGPLSAEVGRPPGRLRVGLLDHPADGSVPADPDAAAAAGGAAKALAELGHRVEEDWPAALAEPDFGQHFLTVVAVGVAADLAAIETRLGREVADAELERDNATLRYMGRSVSAPDYVANITWLHTFGRRLASWWAGGFDVLVTPVLNGPPPRLGWLTDPDHGTERVAQLLQYTPQFNMSGQPAVSLPLHWTPGGLPVGVQLVAAAGREDLLVRLGAQLEEARPWADRRPPLAG